jgi:hypothetical protein
VIHGVPVELLRTFSAFRRAAEPEDVAPPPMVVRSVGLAEPRWGLNPALGRVVRTEDPTRRFFLVPGDGLLGFYDEQGNGAVLPVDHAVTGQSVGSAFRGAGRLEVSGLLPDGVDQVTITRRNGQTIEASVPDHVYAVIIDVRTADALPANVRFLLNDGVRINRVPGADEEFLTLRSPAQR